MELSAQSAGASGDMVMPRTAFNPPCDGSATQWFAAYTVANHEKRVARQLADRAIRYYLPLYQSVRQWKDRRMRLDRPLFPGYVFVEMGQQDRLKVIQIPSLVRLVGFGNQPTALPESDVAAIRLCLEQTGKVEPHPVISAGQRVRIVGGALAGMEGIVARKKGVSRLVLCVSLIMRAVAIEVDETDVESIPYSSPRNGWSGTKATKELATQFL